MVAGEACGQPAKNLVKRGVGRPPATHDTKALVMDMVENNITSPRNIAGELQKLGHDISHTTVFNILKANGISTDPDRKAQSWKQFIQGRMDLIWASDFFTEEVWTLTGLVTVYVLFFIHIKTRRAYVMGCTHPVGFISVESCTVNLLSALFLLDNLSDLATDKFIYSTGDRLIFD